MSTPNEPKTREEIQRAFTPLVRAHEAKASQISTKAEEAEQVRDREIVEKAATYTVESIVNGLAKLQLEFGGAIQSISDQLSGESTKLAELKRAIEVETQRLKRLESTIVAAEALAILRQDHAQKLAAFEEKAKEETRELEQDIADTRAQWQREAEEHEAAVKAYDEGQDKERTQAAEEHQYDRERQAKVVSDERAERRRQRERELAEKEAEREKDWAAREKVLADANEEIEKLRGKVEAFPNELEEAKKKARDKAISSVNKEAKFEAEMLEKEHAGNSRVSELKIQTLEERIARQAEQIAELSSKLDSTIAKSQNLAEQAFHRPTAPAGE